MKAFLLTTLFFLTAIMSSYGQSEPSIAEGQKLATLAKIWGFLKYYHPSVSRGRRSADWDSVLVSKIAPVRACRNASDLSAFFEKWLEELGPVAKCDKCPNGNTFISEMLDLRFLKNVGLFLPALREKFEYIRQNRTLTPYWTNINVGAGNATFEREKAYADLIYPDEGYRLLSLFRFWNIIHYYYPYKNLIGRDWNAVLDEFIPRFIAAENNEDYHLACHELVASIHDSHANYTPPLSADSKFGKLTVPFGTKIIKGQAVITELKNETLCKELDIQLGDVETHIDQRPVAEWVQERWNMTGASNDAVKFRNLATLIFSGSSPQYTLSFWRNGKVETKYSKRFEPSLINYKPKEEEFAFREISNDIGYVNMGALTEKMIEPMYSLLGKKKFLILDIRNYPQGTLFKIAEKLKPKPSPFVKFIKPILTYPGMFQMTDASWCGTDNPNYYKGKVILLCDENTQSHAEYTIMGLQTAPNVVTVGSQTAGADGNISTIPFVGGGKCWMSGIGVFYPDGQQAQRAGVRIDIEARPTIAGLIAGKDEVLEKAIEIAQ